MSQRRGFHRHLGRLISIRLLIVQCDVYMVPSSLLVFTCIYLVLTRQPGALTCGSQPSRRDATWCSPARDACVQFFFYFFILEMISLLGSAEIEGSFILRAPEFVQTDPYATYVLSIAGLHLTYLVD
jgi:hypothetical protein